MNTRQVYQVSWQRRNAFRTLLKDYLFAQGIKYTIEEEKHWLSTTFRVAVECSLLHDYHEFTNSLCEVLGIDDV